MSVLTPCSAILTVDWKNFSKACDVVRFISQTTTPENFDKKILKVARGDNYNLRAVTDTGGMSALFAAAFRGNPDLVAHIIKLGGPSLINAGNEWGLTPLFFAVCNINHQSSYLTTKELVVHQRACVNITTLKTYQIPFASPLWMALKENHRESAKLLLAYGALASPQLTPAQEQLMAELTKENAVGAKMVSKSIALFSSLPNELGALIQAYFGCCQFL